MTLSQIKKMDGDEVHKALAVIEGQARFTGKALTEAQKKQIKALEKRSAEIGDKYIED